MKSRRGAAGRDALNRASSASRPRSPSRRSARWSRPAARRTRRGGANPARWPSRCGGTRPSTTWPPSASSWLTGLPHPGVDEPSTASTQAACAAPDADVLRMAHPMGVGEDPSQARRAEPDSAPDKSCSRTTLAQLSSRGAPRGRRLGAAGLEDDALVTDLDRPEASIGQDRDPSRHGRGQSEVVGGGNRQSTRVRSRRTTASTIASHIRRGRPSRESVATGSIGGGHGRSGRAAHARSGAGGPCPTAALGPRSRKSTGVQTRPGWSVTRRWNLGPK